MNLFKFFHKKAEICEIKEATIGTGNQSISLVPNYDDMQIAYKLWVELSTRKIGLGVDLENDVIKEVYDSWYETFKLMRELIKNIPVNKIRKNDSTKELVKISIEVLNVVIRPHLTKWQAKFRKWYNAEVRKEENKDLSPQEIQRKFPEYKDLSKEMLEVNQKLKNYREILLKLAIGK